MWARLMLAKIRWHKWFIIACVVGFTCYFASALYKHLHFSSTGFDLVIFDQAVRHYSEFMAPASSFRGFSNLLGDHFHPILILLAPLYWIYDSPITLLFAQALLVASAAIPIYRFGLKKIGQMPATFVVIAFLFSGAVLRMVYFDFHEIAFAIPLIAWAIYFMETNKWLPMYISLALLLLTKESFGMLVVFFGIYLLTRRKIIHGISLVIGGVTAFLVTTKIVIPFFAGGGEFMYWSYDQLGKDLGSSLVTIMTNPLFALSLLFVPVVKVVTLIKTFGVYLGINFLSPLMILAVPLLLERFLSSTENYWQFTYHYGATLMPITAMALIDGLPRLYKFRFMKRFKKENVYQYITASIAVVISLLFFVSPLTTVMRPSTYTLSDDEKKGYALLGSINDDASLCVTNHIAPHVGKHELTHIGITEVKKLSCDTIITSTQYDQSPLLSKTITMAKSQGYSLKQTSGSWLVYKK